MEDDGDPARADRAEGPRRRTVTVRQPAPAVVEVGEHAIRRLTAADAGWAMRLRDKVDNGLLLELPDEETESGRYIEELRRGLYSLPMACLRDGAAVGLALTGLGSARNLNAFVLAVFDDPGSATLPLAIFVRHVFWTFPLHRLYTQIPLTPRTEGYVRLFEGVGFNHEGVMSAHAMAGGEALDVACLGLLRTDFDDWARAREPRLAL